MSDGIQPQDGTTIGSGAEIGQGKSAACIASIQPQSLNEQQKNRLYEEFQLGLHKLLLIDKALTLSNLKLACLRGVMSQEETDCFEQWRKDMLLTLRQTVLYVSRKSLEG